MKWRVTVLFICRCYNLQTRIYLANCACTLAGNKYLAEVTAVAAYILRVDLTDWAGVYVYADYSDFNVGGPATNYTLTTIGTYSGNASE